MSILQNGLTRNERKKLMSLYVYRSNVYTFIKRQKMRIQIIQQSIYFVVKFVFVVMIGKCAWFKRNKKKTMIRENYKIPGH